MNMKLVLGIIMIAIVMIMFPIVMDATHSILNNANIADFTGLSALAAISPLMIWVAVLFGGGMLTFQGVKGASKGKKGKR